MNCKLNFKLNKKKQKCLNVALPQRRCQTGPSEESFLPKLKKLNSYFSHYRFLASVTETF